MNKKQAIILAGGKGTRLKPYTISMPKPLVPVNGKPILENLILKLKSHGFTEIVLTVNHMADMIKAYFKDGSKWGINITYTYETTPLSTMGPLTLVKNLHKNFIVLNGDVLTDLNFSEFLNGHIDSSSLFTISAHRRIEKIDYGVLNIDNMNKLKSLEEKPNKEFLVSMGVYALSKKIIQFIPKNTFYGFDHLMYDLLQKKVDIKVEEFDGFWLDIGRPSDYEKAIQKYAN